MLVVLAYFALRHVRRQRLNHIFAGMRIFWPRNQQLIEDGENGGIQQQQQQEQQQLHYKYDALVYHHDRDTDFVHRRLCVRLEEPPNDFQLCLPLTRDFRLGARKLNVLRESIISSRCAIFVIGKAFVQDARCRQALEVGCDYLHRDDLGPPHLKQTGLLLIILDPVLLEQLPEAIRVLVDRLVTLEWDDLDEERCWKRLEQNLLQFRQLNVKI